MFSDHDYEAFAKAHPNLVAADKLYSDEKIKFHATATKKKQELADEMKQNGTYQKYGKYLSDLAEKSGLKSTAGD